MKNITVCDRTICKAFGLTFREKLDISRYLDKLGVNIIELSEIKDVKADILLIKTILSFVSKSTISVDTGTSMESAELALKAIEGYQNVMLRVELPVSPVGIEYTCHKKPASMLELIKNLVMSATSRGIKCEFCAIDATRAEPEFLKQALNTAVEAGADTVCVCENAGEMPPDEFAEFAKDVKNSVSVPVGVHCSCKPELSVSYAVLAAKNGIDFVKTAVCSNAVPLEAFAEIMRDLSAKLDASCSVSYTVLNRTISKIYAAMGHSAKSDDEEVPLSVQDEKIKLDKSADRATVSAYTEKLGYELSNEDSERVYEEFKRVAEKKPVGEKELDAIIAATAMQVPASYRLESYVVNTGNIVSPSAQIILKYGDKSLQDIGIGDGPIDAAFLTLEKIIGRHFELDEFRIESVTEGHEAMGSAIVKLRSEGKLYGGNGISTDILGASIRAYINAVNKILYEESL